MRPPPTVNLRAVDAVLESLRRGQRQLARDPRGAVEAAVAQLLSLGRGRPAQTRPDPDRRTYRIDDLAQLTNVTVRNIRAYQERGLLPPPERVGRVALFDDAHVSRLRIITSMLDRGYTTAHITEMLTAWEHGKDLADVLGLEKALVPTPVRERPEVLSRDEARELVGGEVELAVLIDAGLVENQGENVRLVRAELVHNFAEMREYGVGVKDLVRLHQQVLVAIDQITGLLVDEGVRQLGPRFLAETEPSSAQVGELVMLLNRFRELALTAVTGTLADSLDRTVERWLGDYLALVLEKGSRDAG